MKIEVRNFRITDYESAIELWHGADGVEIAEGDSYQSISNYLERNPNASKVALVDNEIVAAVLCGHDGRRGIIYHLAVSRAYRRQGIGSLIVSECLKELKIQGIERVIILVNENNHLGMKFWRRIGWDRIDEATAIGINL